MKKTTLLLALTVISANTFAVEQLTTSDLKGMDCASLAVEKSNSKRALDKANEQIANLEAQAQAPANKVSKWASLAGSALGAFSGNSQSVAKASEVANNMSANDQSQVVAENLEHQKLIQSNAQSNIDNIAIYQDSKKCKI